MANGSAPYRRNLATWDSVRGCLREIFFSLVSEVGSGEVLVPLSNVKRLFRIRFRLELSETALGHAKLSELLQDPRLADICEVKLQGHGYVVVPKCFLFSSCYFPAAPAAAPSSFLPKSGIRPIHIAEELGYPAPPAGARGAPEVPAWCPPGSASNSAQMEEPTARSSQTAESSSSSTTCCHTGSEDAGAPASSHYEKNDKAVEKIRVSLVHELSRKADAEPEDDDWTKNIIKNSFIQFAIPPTPRPGSLLSRPRSHSLPKDMGSGKCVFETMCHAVSYRGARLGGPATCPSAAFAPTAEDHANPQDYEDLEWDTDFPETACRRNAHVEMMTPYAPSPEGTRPATPACCYCPTPSDSSPTTPTPTPTTVGSVPAPWQWLAPMEGAFGDGGYDFLNQPMADICASHGEEGHSFGDLNYIGFNY